jgi:hypothetical protein
MTSSTGPKRRPAKKAPRPRLSTRPGAKSLFETHPSPIVNILTSLVMVVLAYAVSMSLYMLVVRISQIPQGDVWIDGFKTAFQFVTLMVLVLALLIPVFQREFDPGVRMFSLFTATMLVGYTVTRAAGFDPDAPLQLLMEYVVRPLMRWAESVHT